MSKRLYHHFWRPKSLNNIKNKSIDINLRRRFTQPLIHKCQNSCAIILCRGNVQCHSFNLSSCNLLGAKNGKVVYSSKPRRKQIIYIICDVAKGGEVQGAWISLGDQELIKIVKRLFQTFFFLLSSILRTPPPAPWVSVIWSCKHIQYLNRQIEAKPHL